MVVSWSEYVEFLWLLSFLQMEEFDKGLVLWVLVTVVELMTVEAGDCLKMTLWEYGSKEISFEKLGLLTPVEERILGLEATDVEGFLSSRERLCSIELYLNFNLTFDWLAGLSDLLRWTDLRIDRFTLARLGFLFFSWDWAALLVVLNLVWMAGIVTAGTSFILFRMTVHAFLLPLPFSIVLSFILYLESIAS